MVFHSKPDKASDRSGFVARRIKIGLTRYQNNVIHLLERGFAEFAKLERLAVIRRFRHTRLAFSLIKAGIAFCQVKGYRKLYGNAEPRFVKLWERFGFRPRTADATFSFSSLEFVIGDLELPLHPEALTTQSDPYVLVRPEGQWARPGVLDRSTKTSERG